MEPVSSISIGNFKGVMLCNRPLDGGFAGGAGRAVASSDTKKSFVAGGCIHESFHPRGSNPMVKDLEDKMRKRPKKDNALSKHRKWLRDVQNQRKEVKQMLESQMLEQEEKKRKFDEQQKKLRDQIRGVEEYSEEKMEEEEEEEEKCGAEEKTAEIPKLTLDEQLLAATRNANEKVLARKRKRELTEKPAWARTEEQEEELEDMEAAELMEFVGNLDFDKYMEDVEVRAALKKIKEAADKDRSGAADEQEADIADVDDEEDEEQIEPNNGGEKPKMFVPKKGLTLKTLQKHSGNSEAPIIRQEDDSRSVAQSVLSSCTSLRGVHSAKSISAVIEQRKKKREAAKMLPVVDEDEELNPRIVVVDEEDGIRLKNKLNPSQLPYINRNPAI